MVKGLTSIIIPARNEQFLIPTIQDLLSKARGEIEIIPILEEYWPENIGEITDPRVHYIHNGTAQGMRKAVNQGAAVAKGEYLMKCDAHCMFGEGYDEILKADLEPNWIAVPRRFSLDAEKWEPQRKKAIDYMFLCAPTDPNDFGGPSLHGKIWSDKQNDASLKEMLIDDLMSAQGSCWMMYRDYFYYLELEDAVHYGDFCFEFQEIGLNAQLSGGRVIRNKKTWYAHLHKGRKYTRGWHLAHSTLDKGAAHSNKFMAGKNFTKQDRDIRWLINEFWPVPTWSEESVKLVFHRVKGGSGQIRGLQTSKYFNARLNPDTGWHYDFDVHVWVKMEPEDISLPGKHYLDILDEPRRVPWLKEHPEIGVIASSQSGFEYLKEELKNQVLFIPQHHCNFERIVRDRDELLVAGVVGGQGAIQCDIDELKENLAMKGITEFKWLKNPRNPKEIVEFYKTIDVQIVWRSESGDRPLKNPLKIINAMSFGIPTLAYPEIGYQEIEGYYWRVGNMRDVRKMMDRLTSGFDAQRLIDEAEKYHIDNIAPLYRSLL